MTIELNPKLLDVVQIAGTKGHGTVVDVIEGTPGTVLIELSDEQGVPLEFLRRRTNEVTTIREISKTPEVQSEVPAAQKYFENGILYLQNGLIPRAKEELAKAFSLDEQLAGALSNSTGILAQQGSFDAAIVVYEMLVELLPGYKYARENLSITHLNRGVEFARRGLFAKAIEDFDRALMFTPSENIVEAIRKNTAAIYGNLGVVSSEMKQHEQASQLFQWSLELYPSEVARKNVALAKIAIATKAGMRTPTEEIFSEPMMMGLTLSECLNAYGATLAGLEELAEARRALESALEANPQNDIARRNLMTLSTREGSVVFAVGVVRPGDPVPHRLNT